MSAEETLADGRLPVSTAACSFDERTTVEDFIYHEARLIDERQLEAWYALFAEDAVYWVPAARGQQDMETSVSFACEDRLLLRLRIDRLKHPRAHSQKLASHSQHVLQRPRVERSTGPDGQTGSRTWETHTPFIYVESRGDVQLLLAGVASHTLVQHADSQLRIRRKRIDLLNCEAALPSIEGFL